MCDTAKKDIMRPKYVESGLMMAGILTKALPALRMAELRKLFSLR